MFTKVKRITLDLLIIGFILANIFMITDIIQHLI